MKFPDHLQVPESIAPLPPSLLLTFRTRRTIRAQSITGVFARCTSGTVVVVGGGQLVVRKAVKVKVSQDQSQSKSPVLIFQ